MSKEQGTCAAVGKCGGCTYLHTTYDKQLAVKEEFVRKAIGGFCPVHPITGMADPYHYRNKVHAVFSGRKGKVVTGSYQEGSHKVVPTAHCLLEDEAADAIIQDIRRLAESFRLTVYDEDRGTGLLRHVLVRRGFATGQVLAVLVTASPVFPSRKNFAAALKKLHPEITSLVVNLNDRRTSMVLGERSMPVYGKGWIEDELCGMRFRISPASFYQVNPVQTERLYKKAIDLAGLTGRERVIDAYCGIGTIGLVASGAAGQVTGVELNREAVRDARENAAANRAKNIRFVCADATAWMEEARAAGERADVVFLDPPRSGSTPAFLKALAGLAPARVVYVSCNPETLGRDLRILAGDGYRAVEAWPFDMFPWTQAAHVETAVLLVRH